MTPTADIFGSDPGAVNPSAAHIASVKEVLAGMGAATSMRITEPGFYEMPSEVYHAHPAISNSYLFRLNKCPGEAKVPQETTDAMVFGSAAHCFTLEGELAFFAQYAVSPKVDRRTTAGKATWADFIAGNPDRTIISVEDFTTITAISEAVHAHPFAAKLLECGKAEQSVFWTDSSTGIQMKCRPDWMTEAGVLVDLKTTTDASEHGFTRSVTGYGYHRQAALYLDGVNEVVGGFDAFAFIAVEKTAPFRVEVYTLDPDFIHAGRCDYRRLLGVEQSCRMIGTYPAFQNPGVTELIKPAYI